MKNHQVIGKYILFLEYFYDLIQSENSKIYVQN